MVKYNIQGFEGKDTTIGDYTEVGSGNGNVSVSVSDSLVKDSEIDFDNCPQRSTGYRGSGNTIGDNSKVGSNNGNLEIKVSGSFFKRVRIGRRVSYTD